MEPVSVSAYAPTRRTFLATVFKKTENGPQNPDDEVQIERSMPHGGGRGRGRGSAPYQPTPAQLQQQVVETRENIIRLASNAGTMAAYSATHNLEAAFTNAFVDTINNLAAMPANQPTGHMVISAGHTGANEPQTGADVLLTWWSGIRPQQVYLQIKKMYNTYDEYAYVTGNNTYPGFVGQRDFFDLWYRSRAHGPFYGHYQVARIQETVDQAPSSSSFVWTVVLSQNVASNSFAGGSVSRTSGGYLLFNDGRDRSSPASRTRVVTDHRGNPVRNPHTGQVQTAVAPPAPDRAPHVEGVPIWTFNRQTPALSTASISNLHACLPQGIISWPAVQIQHGPPPP
ncbi:hypothetical protein T439DRAFT_330831 [Meredithblackwellia eburnea MCA 4105]